MRLSDVLPVLESIAPLRLAEGWDNVGLLVGDPAAEIRAALLCIDYTPGVAAEAREKGAELVYSYHPPIFEAMKRVVAPGPIFEAIRDGIAIYSPHTALDVAEGGTNDLLADVLGLGRGLPARRPMRAPGAKFGPAPEGESLGLGRIGELEAAVPREELLERIKRGLGIEALLVAGPTTGPVRTVAASAGAAGAMVEDALGQGAELYLTGEMRHHDALRAAKLGMTVVCALHSNSERAVLPRIRERIAGALPGLPVFVSGADRDPFVVR
ncbi:Nif3-like dinuclear metal center hexameric protein [Polyangium sp. 6x1]|uniref:Nif3-like dinuclear metal center hexameric protein n=1 Tax=Polyangium sp. 6x1 TaxID=3042689 RepID=UPI0024830340|nr:Nif3-like dinuclear metal center hexameric protein [Polyangium sp. 6x1]MDI1450007.1 Nif3-like dinuclear metal center hexameric protein [Polyangium sp. 6x1]